MSNRNHSIGYLLAASGAALFSTKAIFIKLAFVETPDAALMLAYRMIFATPFYVAIGIWAHARRKASGAPDPTPRQIAEAAVTGLIGYYVASEFDFAGLAYISAQLERLVLFTYPMFVMFIAAVVYGERITRWGLMAALVTYLGLAIVFIEDLPEGGHNTIIGTLLVLGAAISFAWHQILARRFVGALGSALFTSIALAAAGFACVAHQAIVGHFSFAASERFLWLSFACAIVATLMPTFLINASLQRITPQAVSMISTLSPIVTVALAVVILGEDFTIANALGSLLVLAGVGLYTWGDARAQR